MCNFFCSGTGMARKYQSSQQLLRLIAGLFRDCDDHKLCFKTNIDSLVASVLATVLVKSAVSTLPLPLQLLLRRNNALHALLSAAAATVVAPGKELILCPPGTTCNANVSQAVGESWQRCLPACPPAYLTLFAATHSCSSPARSVTRHVLPVGVPCHCRQGHAVGASFHRRQHPTV